MPLGVRQIGILRHLIASPMGLVPLPGATRLDGHWHETTEPWTVDGDETETRVRVMSDVTSERLVGASVSEQELYEHLTEHVRKERSVLEAYVAAADATDSKALAYVVKLLIDDERHHHLLFQQLAESLKHDAEFHSGDPAIPRLDFTVINGPSGPRSDRRTDRSRAR